MSAFSEANRKAFDDLSSTYNTKPWQARISSQISDSLQARKDWIGVEWAKPGDGRDVRLLDYACGTGAMTKALGPYVTTIRGIDLSENMVKVYNEAARSSGLSVEQANAVAGNLIATPVPEHLNTPDLEDFDVAVIGLGFHHFEDPALAIKRLSERVKPKTGTIVIIDWLPLKKPSEMGDMAHTIKQNGFTEEDMAKFFGDAGLVDFGFDVLEIPITLELNNGPVDRVCFFAKARRA